MTVRRRFAQHFLEPAWVRKLVEVFAPDPQDIVVEIGPGRGALTAAVAPLVRQLVVIEVDRDLAATLRQTRHPGVDVIEGDVLRVDLGKIVADCVSAAQGTGRVRVIGNLPYNISSPILLRLVGLARSNPSLHDATIMLQREVADRVIGAPGGGDWGPLAIAIQMHADVARALALPPGAFRPPPKVHSAVLRLTFRPPSVHVADEALFDSVVRAVFSQRRKTIANALRAFATGMGCDSLTVLRAADIDPMRRPETLSLEEFARLTAQLIAEK